MPNGFLNSLQRAHVSKVVSNRVVTDLGAGDLFLSKQLLALGANSVIAVDKERYTKKIPSKITYKQALFSKIIDPIDIAFISWPSNYENHLTPLASHANTIIYLGKNTDGSACGTPSLFQHFLLRSVLIYIPDRANTLIIYGSPLNSPRLPLGEEAAAIFQQDILSYEKAESIFLLG